MEFRKMLMITLYAEQKKKDTDLWNFLFKELMKRKQLDFMMRLAW